MGVAGTPAAFHITQDNEMQMHGLEVKQLFSPGSDMTPGFFCLDI